MPTAGQPDRRPRLHPRARGTAPRLRNRPIRQSRALAPRRAGGAAPAAPAPSAPEGGVRPLAPAPAQPLRMIGGCLEARHRGREKICGAYGHCLPMEQQTLPKAQCWASCVRGQSLDLFLIYGVLEIQDVHPSAFHYICHADYAVCVF